MQNIRRVSGSKISTALQQLFFFPRHVAGTKIRCNCLLRETTPTLRSADMRLQSMNVAPFSGRTSGFRKTRRRIAARATSSRSGSPAFTAMSAGLSGIRERPFKNRAALDAQGGHQCRRSRNPRTHGSRARQNRRLCRSRYEILWKRHYNWARQKWERRPNLGRQRTIPPNWNRPTNAVATTRGMPPDAIPTG